MHGGDLSGCNHQELSRQQYVANSRDSRVLRGVLDNLSNFKGAARYWPAGTGLSEQGTWRLVDAPPN